MKTKLIQRYGDQIFFADIGGSRKETVARYIDKSRSVENFPGTSANTGCATAFSDGSYSVRYWC